jgi:hypothetical protein
MQNPRTTAGKTAKTNNYPKRVRLFSPDGHANKDVVTIVDDIYTERFVRAHARRIGWRISIRRIDEAKPIEATKPAPTTWRKPSALADMPRPKLGGAFNLALTQIMEGGMR